jgi:2'-5' RNA ligase
VTAQPRPAAVLGVALAVPEPIASYVQGLRERFGDPLARAIPTHVTLLPPTTVDGTLMAEIDAHLAAVAAGLAPFPVELRGSGTFRPVSPVVYVALADGVAGCRGLEAAVRSGVLWRPVQFDYHPHVTVAHDLPDAVLDEAAAALADYTATFVVDRFTRYEHADGVWVPSRDFQLSGTAHLAPDGPG